MTKFGLGTTYLRVFLITIFVDVFFLIIQNWLLIFLGAILTGLVFGLGQNISDFRKMTILQRLIKQSKWVKVRRGHILFSTNRHHSPVLIMIEQDWNNHKKEEKKHGN